MCLWRACFGLFGGLFRGVLWPVSGVLRGCGLNWLVLLLCCLAQLPYCLADGKRVPAFDVELALAGEEPFGRDVEVAHQVGKLCGLEDVAAVVAFEGVEVPAVDVV